MFRRTVARVVYSGTEVDILDAEQMTVKSWQ